MPEVSVIIPCFNQGPFLDEAVESVLAQTYRDFEVLILDDGSTDEETRQILAAYERPRTTVFIEENRGLAGARNFLVERAQGKYLCALDADDRLHPEYLARAVATFEDDPGLTFVSSWLGTFGEEEWTWRQDRCDLVALLCECTVTTAALVRRDAVLEAGGYDQEMPEPGYEDWDLWISLLEGGARGTIIPEPLFLYRRRAGSMSGRCCSEEGHLRLFRYLMDKHGESYRRYLDEIMAWKDSETSALLRDNYEIERRVAARLRPELELRRAEIASQYRKLEEAERRAACERDVVRLRGEVEALETRLGRETTERETKAAQDAETIAGLQREAGDLRETLAEREAELSERLRETEVEIERLNDALDGACGERDALIASRSWRVTAPARAVLSLVKRLLERGQ